MTARRQPQLGRRRRRLSIRHLVQQIDLALLQRAQLSGPQALDAHSGVGRAEQAHHRVAHRGAQALDEVRTALGHDNLQPGVLLGGLEHAHGHRRGHSIFQPDATAQLVQRGHIRLALHLRQIRARHLEARVRQLVRQRSIIREEQRAFRVVVQPAHGEQPLARLLHVVGHRRPPLRVRQRRHHAHGLVEQEVRGFVRRSDELPVHRHQVRSRLHSASQLRHRRVVHRHAARGDQLFCMPARSDSRAGQVLL
ncbi:hypothetical protein WA016_07711 [Myxococcus stipitatus]